MVLSLMPQKILKYEETVTVQVVLSLFPDDLEIHFCLKLLSLLLSLMMMTGSYMDYHLLKIMF